MWWTIKVIWWSIQIISKSCDELSESYYDLCRSCDEPSKSVMNHPSLRQSKLVRVHPHLQSSIQIMWWTIQICEEQFKSCDELLWAIWIMWPSKLVKNHPNYVMNTSNHVKHHPNHAMNRPNCDELSKSKPVKGNPNLWWWRSIHICDHSHWWRKSTISMLSTTLNTKTGWKTYSK